MITYHHAITSHYRQTFYHATEKDSQGQAIKCRVNGRCQTWKTRPGQFKLPVKYGLKDCFYITPANAGEWLPYDPTASKTTIAQ